MNVRPRFNRERRRFRRESFADTCPKLHRAAHVELAAKDEGGGPVVVDALDTQDAAGKGAVSSDKQPS
jgi:hypothetical protein